MKIAEVVRSTMPKNFRGNELKIRCKKCSKNLVLAPQDIEVLDTDPIALDFFREHHLHHLFLEAGGQTFPLNFWTDEDRIKEPSETGITALSAIEAKEIKWLWNDRIPYGMPTLLAGDPGIGKSFFSCWLASKLSRGEALPGQEPNDPVNSLLINLEDPPDVGILPRVLTNKGDPAKIYINSNFESLEDIFKLEPLIVEKEIKFLIIDPLNALLSRIDYFRDPQVRRALKPLVEFSNKTGVAMLLITHLNKKEDSDSLYRIGGSIGFVGLARSVLAITKDPETPNDCRVLASLKSNYSQKPPNLAFRIKENLELVIVGNSDTETEALFNRARRDEERETSWVCDWLEEALTDELPTKEILEQAKNNGIPRATVFRAKKKLGVVSRTKGFGSEKVTFWSLP